MPGWQKVCNTNRCIVAQHLVHKPIEGVGLDHTMQRPPSLLSSVMNRSAHAGTSAFRVCSYTETFAHSLHTDLQAAKHSYVLCWDNTCHESKYSSFARLGTLLRSCASARGQHKPAMWASHSGGSLRPVSLGRQRKTAGAQASEDTDPNSLL